MTKIIVAAIVAATLFAAPAFADCAGGLAKIDEAMKTMKLDDAGTAKATELTDKAKAAQAANDEAACSSATAELMMLLGMPAPQ